MSPRKLERIDRSVDQADPYFGGGTNGNFLQGRYGTDAIYAWFQQRHRLTGKAVVDSDGYCRVRRDDGKLCSWRVPYGVRYALNHPLIHAQIVSKYPWYVTWVSPKDGRRLKKKFESLATAIVFVTTRAQFVDPDAGIIARIGYDVPPKLRGKLPHKKFGYWCPCCMTARKFYAQSPEATFHAYKKVWVAEEGRYIPTLRELKVLQCKVCGLTNRDHKFRRSNQPWTVRKFKRGVTRARRRRR